MTNDTRPEPASSSIDIYEVSFTEWGAPIVVLARSFGAAKELAARHRGDDRGPGAVLIRHATAEWLSLSNHAEQHLQAADTQGNEGVADYDDDQGWRLL